MSNRRPSGGALVIRAALVLAGIIGIVAAWGAYLIDSAILADGPRAQGVITGKYTVFSADGDSSFNVEYSFALPSGERLQSRASLSKAQWSALEKGQSIVVVYSSSNPRRNFPLGGGVTSLSTVWFVTAVSLVIGMLGLTVLCSLLGQHTAA